LFEWVLALSRKKAVKRAVETSQHARVAELERANVELRAGYEVVEMQEH
jgi:hypothetical protein